jgi:hypothetical protein
MQTTIGTQATARVRRLKVHHLTLAGGLALAVAAAVGLSGLEGDGVRTAQPAPPAAEQVAIEHARPAQLLVYVVSSAEEKRALEQDVATSPGWFTETSGIDTTVRVVVLDSDTEESLESLARALPEASISAGIGPALKLVDMR